MSSKRILWIAGGFALAAAAVLAAWATLPIDQWAGGIGQWIKGLGAMGILLFVVSYVVAIVVLVPAAPFSILAGMVYGFWAVPLALASATFGATLAFLIARHLAGPTVRQAVEARPRFMAVDRAVAEESWKIVVLLRLSPLLPFAVASYMLGVTSLSLPSYVVATFVGIIPGVVLYVYLGVLGRLAASGAAGPLEWMLFILGLAATIAVAAIIVRKAQEKLREMGVAGVGGQVSVVEKRGSQPVSGR